MENYYFKKYNKYKFKYLKLKKQVAGAGKGEVNRMNEDSKETAKELNKQLSDLNITKKLKNFYDEKIKLNNQVFGNRRDSEEVKKEKKEKAINELKDQTIKSIFSVDIEPEKLQDLLPALKQDSSQHVSYSEKLEELIGKGIFDDLFKSIETSDLLKNINSIINLYRVVISDENQIPVDRTIIENNIGSKEQMKKFWGEDLVDSLCNKDDRLKYNCFLCSGEISADHKIEMEHKIDTKNAHLIFHPVKLELITLDKKAKEPASPKAPASPNTKMDDKKIDNYMTQWTNFANHSDLSDLYMVINSNTYNSDTYMKNVNDRMKDVNKSMNDLSITFKNYLEKSYIIENDDFNLAFSVIKFWLVEYAYAHHTCNNKKSARTFYKNDKVDSDELDKYYDALKSEVTPVEGHPMKKQRKVTEDNQKEVIKTQIESDPNYQETFICSLELLKRYENEIYSNYAGIKNIDKDLARKILIVKITRMLAYGRSK